MKKTMPSVYNQSMLLKNLLHFGKNQKAKEKEIISRPN